MSIFPYAYFLISSFHITEDEKKIALYVGMVTSAFTFAEFSTGMFWGRVSDRIGRKPVLIMGLAGTALSMIVFGFAPSLPVALLARALGGLLNGNIGVLQTVVAEIVTEKEHQPRAYSIMPFVWCLGSIIGPALGGTLAQPADNYPSWFSRGSLLDRFPFLLPNLVCTGVLIVGIIIGLLFLEETHAEKKYRRDIGLEVGRWLLGSRSWNRDSGSHTPLENSDEDCQSLFEEPPPGYSSTQATPRPSVQGPARETPEDVESNLDSQKPGFSKAFTKQVIFCIVGYGILAYHSVSFDQLMPVFLSTPVSDETPTLPFKFTGGLALSSKSIGLMLAVQGVYSMVAQLWFFPFLARHFGTLRIFRFVLIVWPALYLVVPYLVLLPARLQMTATYAALITKITMHVIAFPSTAILLANAAPSHSVLGSINGVAASTASLSRAFGPTVSGLLHSKGLECGYSGLAWWACGIVSVIGAVESFWVEDVDAKKTNESEKPRHQSLDTCDINNDEGNIRLGSDDENLAEWSDEEQLELDDESGPFLGRP
ncbi:hypothetical protein FQN54_000140 [Arachnomyces sp. PD_36]|nr:hypothetical protein FQN54_000140 [Arachnomyces sp. PD_36]